VHHCTVSGVKYEVTASRGKLPYRSGKVREFTLLALVGTLVDILLLSYLCVYM